MRSRPALVSRAAARRHFCGPTEIHPSIHGITCEHGEAEGEEIDGVENSGNRVESLCELRRGAAANDEHGGDLGAHLTPSLEDRSPLTEHAVEPSSAEDVG